MTGSHSPDAHGLNSLFSVSSPAPRRAEATEHADEIAEIVDITPHLAAAPPMAGPPPLPPQFAGFSPSKSQPPTTQPPTGLPPTPQPPTTGPVVLAEPPFPDAPLLTEPCAALEFAPPPTGLPAVPVTLEGLPLSLDVFAVATRAVVVLIGTDTPARQIAKTAIGLSIESEQTAAIDVVVPRAIDLVLQRAKELIAAGLAAQVVDRCEERAELWRRLSMRSGLEPAAIVLSLAPFPLPTIASMLRVSLVDLQTVVASWQRGDDPIDGTPVTELAPAIITSVVRPSVAPLELPAGQTANPAGDPVGSGVADTNLAEESALSADHGALDEFLALPDGRGSRIRRLLRRA